MKILYFNYLYDSNQDSVGASVHVREFVQAMIAQGCDIKVYNLNPAHLAGGTTRNSWARLRAKLKVRLRYFLAQPNQLLRNLPLFFRERRILSEEKPDVLLIRYNLLNFSGVLAAKMKKIPVVLEVNSPHAFERKNLVKDIWQIPFIPFLVEWLSMRLADRLVTVSSALKGYYLERKIPADKISVIPNGVDVQRFNPETVNGGIRQQYGLTNDIVLGFVGSFHHWHGIDNILRLIEYLCARFNNVVFLMVGDGPRRKQVEEFVGKGDLADKVVLTGYVPHEDVPKYISAMDIVLAPYPSMNLFYFSPLKIFEYMAAGKALVASRIGQIAEIVQDGQNGFLYEPSDLNDLFNKTEQLISEKVLRNRIGSSARETILQGFTWQRNAEQVMEVLGQAVNRDVR